MINKNCLKNSNETGRIVGGGMPKRKNKSIVGYGDLIVNFNIKLESISENKKNIILEVLQN